MEVARPSYARVIGVNAYHGDSSACLLMGGQLAASAEEERFRRIKHWAGFPFFAIDYCLNEVGISLNDVDVIAINQDSKAHLRKKIVYTLSSRPDFRLVLEKLRNRKERHSIEDALKNQFPNQDFKGKIKPVEHHLAHLSSAFHVSPFEEAVIVSVDGFGDFASGAWGVGRGLDINVDDQVYFPHSLGIFYQAITQYLGFPHYGDEYKVMGLAPYGEPCYLDQMRQMVRLKEGGGYELNLTYFRHAKEKVDYEWDNGAPKVGAIYSPALDDLLGPARAGKDELEQKHKDIAKSAQAMYEEAFFHLLNTLHDKYQIDNLALAGGCAMNSVANGKVYRNTPFKNLYIQSAAGDAGGAIGAALVAAKEMGELKEKCVMDHAFWGPSFSNEQVKKLLDERCEELDQAACSVNFVQDENILCEITANAITEGKVIGWFQGRMEWGPRALGNRSILGDPRRADMKNILNLKIKRRESFRPFAPSILREEVLKWFEEDDDVPFMMQVFQIREEQRTKIPAVTHVDGSGRLQTVHKSTNPRYYSLIQAFQKLTDVPMVLNTSFNENEPVVCKPEEALDCFLRTKMDVLVLENYIVSRT